MIGLGCAVVWAGLVGQAAGTDALNVTREATCRWAKVAPVIDGKLNDPAWADAQVIDKFSAYWDKKNTGDGTKAKLLWDDKGLYYSATMTDAELTAYGTKHNDEIWNGDVFELFFKARTDRPEYHEFEVNPHAAILELPIPGRPFDFAALVKLPPAGLKAVAVVDGTLDKPGDVDKGWSVEGFIPWSAFAISGGKPKPGAVWTFALCRYDYGPKGTEPVLMSSAPLTEGNYHRYEDYSKLTFEGPAK